MSKRKRLQSLKDLAAGNEAEAARRLVASLEELRRCRDELERLRGYLHEYREAAARQGAVDAMRWRDARQFLVRLQEAASAREADFEERLRAHEHEVERWRTTRSRTQAFEKLLDQHDRETARLRERKEQKDLDELNTRRA